MAPDPTPTPSVLARHGAVVLGAVVGALLRHGQGAFFAAFVPGAFPWGTFTINVAGSFALGAFVAALAVTPGAHALWRPFFAVGFCGTYTTFSAFENETLSLISRGRPEVALAYVVASVVVGLAAGLGASGLLQQKIRVRIATPPPLVLAPALAVAAACAVALARVHGVEPRTVGLGCLAVVAGGSAGAIGRYLVNDLAWRWLGGAFPWGTFFINVTGSFAIGFFEGFASRPGGAPPLLRLFFVTGVCGGYTTFSTFVSETLGLARGERPKPAIFNVVGSVLVGFGAVAAGASLGRFATGAH